MARTRTLRPQFFSSFSLAKVSRDARLFFTGLWVEADDEGRLIDSPKQLAGAIFPHDDDVDAAMVIGWLDELIGIGVMQRYEANGGRYLLTTNFAEHQRPPHATPSKLPPPPAKGAKASRTPREKGVSVSRKRSEDIPPDSGEPSDGLTENAPLGLGFNVVGSCLGSCSLDDSGKPPESVDPFATFWDAWPYKIGRPSALKAWKKIKPGELDDILIGVFAWDRYWTLDQTEKNFIPHPARWLNDRRWEAEPPPPRTHSNTPNGHPDQRMNGYEAYAEDVVRQELQA